MNISLNADEDLHSLELNDLKIIQNKKGFRFGIDAVLLSDFAKCIKPNKKIMDLCSGNGIISLLLSAKLINPSITAVEIQDDVAILASKNVLINNLTSIIDVVCCDLNNLPQIYPSSSFDAIVCNPPYKKRNTGLENDLDTKTVARHEVYCNLDDVIRTSSFLLKNNGELYMVHRAERICDILETLRKYHIEPKIIRFVQSYNHKAPTLLLVKAVKLAKPFLKIMDNLVIYNDDGSYTSEINKIYNK